MIVLAVGVAAFTSLKVPLEVPTASPSTLPCQPEPCANVRGFQLWVTDLNTSGDVVTMKVRFQNSSNATHADPADIQLLDAQGHPSNAIHYAPTCPAWPRTEFNNGATFGPVTECFRPANTSPPLLLHWEPDFGPFCCETVIPLEK